MRRRGSGAALVVGACLVGGVSACTKVSSDPNAVVAITFDSLPYPAIVGGDSLRDEAGVALPLRAGALNTDGDTIADAAITFVVLDPGASVSEAGYVVSTDAAVTSLRVLAEAAGLQSRQLTLIVTPRPDSIVRDGTTVGDTLKYVLPDEASNVSAALTLRLFNTQGDPPVNARGWIVRYTFEAAADNKRAWFVDEANKRTAEDTASADGRVSRRVRVVSDSIGATVDSVVVRATAVARGIPLAGSPVRIVIHLRPRS